jgi:hypothetical protein
MSQQCACQALESMVGSSAEDYAGRFLSEVAGFAEDAVAEDVYAGRLMRCRVCGAFWDMQEDVENDEGARRIRLHRVHSADALEDQLPATDEE